MNYRFSPWLLTALALLSATAPFSIDMYLPAFPEIAADLHTNESMVQLTLSSFVAGLALGQLVFGPVSDAVGRKKLLLTAAILTAIAASAAALAPSISILIILRFVQGIGAGGCIVLARAVIPDLAGGQTAARAFATMMAIQTLAPILAPVAGGFLVEPLGWRGLFWCLAGLSLVQLLATIFFIPESREEKYREKVSVGTVLGSYVLIARDRSFRLYLVAAAFCFATMFSYIAASSFFIQQQLGYSPQVFAVAFGVNAVGLLGSNILNARLLKIFNPRTIIRTATITWLIANILLLVAIAIAGIPDAIVFILLFCSVAQQGFIQANAISLGQLRVRERAGTAAALMGFFQFALSAVIGPLTGLWSNAGLAMAVSMVACAMVATVATRRATYLDQP